MCTKVDDHIALNHDLHNKVVIEVSSIVKSTINDIEPLDSLFISFGSGCLCMAYFDLLLYNLGGQWCDQCF